MKKVRLFSVAVAVVAALFVSVWAGTITKNISPTMQGIFSTGSLTLETSPFCVALNGPANSCLTSVTVEGTFSNGGPSNCLISERRIIATCGGQDFIGPTFPNGKFSTTVPIPNPPCCPANSTVCVRLFAKRLQVASDPCAVSISSGVAKFNYSP